jgi:hypothetical protein
VSKIRLDPKLKEITLYEAISKIAHETTPVIESKFRVRITKEWRDWIINHTAIIYFSDKHSMYSNNYAYLIGVLRSSKKNTAIIRFSELPKKVVVNMDNPEKIIEVNYNHCYLTRELIKLYKYHAALEKRVAEKQKKLILKQEKKILSYLGEVNSMPLP